MSKITRKVDEVAVVVKPLENEVHVHVYAEDGILTKKEARKLAHLLLKAVDRAEHDDNWDLVAR